MFDPKPEIWSIAEELHEHYTREAARMLKLQEEENLDGIEFEDFADIDAKLFEEIEVRLLGIIERGIEDERERLKAALKASLN